MDDLGYRNMTELLAAMISMFLAEQNVRERGVLTAN